MTNTNAGIRRWVLLVLLLLVLVGCSREGSRHGDTAYSVSPETLFRQRGGVVVVDVRSAGEYETAHIEGAVSVPLDDMSPSLLTKLGIEKQEGIVVYANSDAPAQRAKALMEALGYYAVKTLSGGFAHWQEDGFPTASGKGNPFVRDEPAEAAASLVVEPAEFDFGIIDKRDGVATTWFSVKNAGSRTVTITEVTTSCGCTSAFLAQRELAPGEEGMLEVAFDPNFHDEPKGRFTRTIFLETSDGNEATAKIAVQLKEEGP